MSAGPQSPNCTCTEKTVVLVKMGCLIGGNGAAQGPEKPLSSLSWKKAQLSQRWRQMYRSLCRATASELSVERHREDASRYTFIAVKLHPSIIAGTRRA